MDQDKSGKLRAHLQTLQKFDGILSRTKDEAMDTGFVITMMDEWKAIEADCPGAVTTFSNASFRVESLRAQLARAEALIAHLLESNEPTRKIGDLNKAGRGPDPEAAKFERPSEFLGLNPFQPEQPSYALWRDGAIAACEEYARFQSKRAGRSIETPRDWT